jgi:hypothetical protein
MKARFNIYQEYEKMQFIDYILDDYEYVLRKKLHPTLIRYYKDVLARLIKSYGH